MKGETNNGLTNENITNSMEKSSENITDKCGINSTVTIWKKLTSIKINRKLIPLKIALHFWFAVGAVQFPFLQVYLRQLGITIYHQSLINTLVPPFQLLAPSVSGLIADKIGRTKPVLVVNLLLTLAVLNAVFYIPKVVIRKCPTPYVEFNCDTLLVSPLATELAECVDGNSTVVLKNCNRTCSNTLNNQNKSYSIRNDWAHGRNLIEAIDTEIYTLGLPIYNYKDTSNNTFCALNTNYTAIETWCDDVLTQNCSINCTADWGECTPYDNSTFVYILATVLMILYYSICSNNFRILDVTAMKMVKEQNTDFGQQRLWSIFSMVIWSPLIGYAIEATSVKGSPKNYAVTFYVASAFVIFCICSLRYLEVTIEPPGKNMFQKTIRMLKNVDILVFVIVLLVLGAEWCFAKLYSALYIAELKGSSLLIGSMTAVNSLIGLPFLVTSNWWLKKLGSSTLLLMAFVGHAVYFTSYSFLRDPLWAIACEIPSIFSYHLLWVAVVTYSHDIAPVGLTATVIATAGGIHYGIGRGTGSLIGGMIMSKYSGPVAFRVMAIMSTVTGALYLAYIYFARRMKRVNENNVVSNTTCESSSL